MLLSIGFTIDYIVFQMRLKVIFREWGSIPSEYVDICLSHLKLEQPLQILPPDRCLGTVKTTITLSSNNAYQTPLISNSLSKITHPNIADFALAEQQDKPFVQSERAPTCGKQSEPNFYL
jgi:hypothetical protein